MKKLITIVAIIISLSASAQVKDTTAKDTVFVLSVSDMQLIQDIVRTNNVVINGKQLNFNEVLQILQYLNSKAMLVAKKEQPKK